MQARRPPAARLAAAGGLPGRREKKTAKLHTHAWKGVSREARRVHSLWGGWIAPCRKGHSQAMRSLSSAAHTHAHTHGGAQAGSAATVAMRGGGETRRATLAITRRRAHGPAALVHRGCGREHGAATIHTPHPWPTHIQPGTPLGRPPHNPRFVLAHASIATAAAMEPPVGQGSPAAASQLVIVHPSNAVPPRAATARPPQRAKLLVGGSGPPGKG